jgi:hypothetical protein
MVRFELMKTPRVRQILRNIAFTVKLATKPPNQAKLRDRMLEINIFINYWEKTFDTTGCCCWVRPCWIVRS